MWIFITILGLSYLFVIIKLLLKLSGCTIQNIQIPVVNWMNSKFNISTRYTVITNNEQLKKFDEDTNDNCPSNVSDEDTDSNSSDDSSNEDTDYEASNEDSNNSSDNVSDEDTNSPSKLENPISTCCYELNNDTTKAPEINKVSNDYDTEDEDSDFQFLSEMVKNKNNIDEHIQSLLTPNVRCNILVDETLD